MLNIPRGSGFTTKTEFAVESLRNAIILGQIPSGTSITEKELRETLQISSSPIREAINQLVAEGLLVRSPHMEARVADKVIEDAADLFAIQAFLQSNAVRMCAKKLSPETIHEAEKANDEIRDLFASNADNVEAIKILNYRFHLLVCGTSLYPWLTRMIAALWIRLPRTIWTHAEEARGAIDYHSKIIEAIKRRDSIRAGSFMRKHLQVAKKVLYG